jgi:phosphopantothenoylcysteine decarboxylase
MDSNAEEPYAPSAFDLPSGSLSEKVAFPERPLHVLLVTTGSVASIKAPLIVDSLLKVRSLVHPRSEGRQQGCAD